MAQSVIASKDGNTARRFRSKAKQKDDRPTEKQRGDAKGSSLQKKAKFKHKLHQVSQHKIVLSKDKLLDKSGKRIINCTKALKDDPMPSNIPAKKRKKVIRIDPHDISNKRIDKSASGKVDSTKIVLSKDKLLDKSGKRIINCTKALKDDPMPSNIPAKKRKKVIRIDPHDISNKRIDESASGKEDVVDKEVTLSMNAQFRAIKPTPAILSFVEDNLLGRRRLIELRNAGYSIKLSAPLDNIPFSTSSERERIEENVFRNKLEFFAAAKISSSLPQPILPEIAFAGRSNVGKSSLLNALTRQWGVVRTSDKPGHTQTINFFRLASKLCLVDLPGYGFAYAKEEVKEAWVELVKEYVSTREGLRRVCLLIDTKWGMKPRDHELIDLMERSQTPYQIVLTKTDVVFPVDVARRAMQIEENLKANKAVVNPVMMVSSKTGAGIRSLRTVLAKISRFVKP